MVVDAWTTIETKDKIIFQINHAWLDEWPMLDIFGQPIKLPSDCNIYVDQNEVEFIRQSN